MKIDLFRFNKLYKSQESKGVKIADDEPKATDNKLAKKLRKKLARKSINKVDEQFYSYILELINTADQFTQEEKNQTVVDISEYYLLQTGYQMPNSMISALADFILDDVLSDPDNDKIANNEYPVMSFRQLEHRRKRESAIGDEVLEYFSNVNNPNTYNPAQKRYTSEKSINE